MTTVRPAAYDISAAWRPSYDTDGWTAREGTGAFPRPPFGYQPRPGDARQTVRDALLAQVPGIVVSSPAFAFPYLVPGASYDQLWTWDAYFTGLAVQQQHPEAFAGSLDNLLSAVTDDGRPPSLIDAAGVPSYQHVAQPVHAQWALAVLRLERSDPSWLPSVWPTLVAVRDWWDRHCRSRHHLYTWIDGAGSGIDNDRAIYGRPGGEVALVDMNCFHVRELRAMAALADELGIDDAVDYRAAAAELTESINTYMWDPADETYYHLHLPPRQGVTLQHATWELPYKVQSWGCLFPLWTGVADHGRADRLVRSQVLNPDRFLSGFGIRSTPADDRMYNNLAMADPSNWQGPVWGLSTMLTCYGLARYGYRAEALRVAGRFIGLLAADLAANGTIHEYYDADSGRPGFNPGFLSWNLLAVRILADVENGDDPTEL
ncbi:amylo-alpha-1,6-glucosidase [Kribbella sp. NPDC059898]|uniref:amylo-alpha-1,6-glucosidase n=1 Tax=Kribbella sp. NPDC059898 TaxID=3346995 RepID=UPI00364E422D